MRLIWLAAMAALAWSGWWFLGARGIEAALAGWLAERRAAGEIAQIEVAGVAGFPGRWQLRLDSPRLGDRARGLVWAASGLEIAAPPWFPTDISLSGPAAQELATPAGTLVVSADGLRSRIRLQPGPALGLISAGAELSGVALAGLPGWSASVERAVLTVARVGSESAVLDLHAEAERMVPPAMLMAALDPEGRLPQHLAASGEAQVAFDAPWDRAAVEVRRPQPRRIDLHRLRLDWGGIGITAEGTLEIDSAGRPEGDLRLRAVNWREALALAVSAGLVEPGQAAQAEAALALVAAASGAPDTLVLSLGFREGAVLLGPVALGPAPVLRLP